MFRGILGAALLAAVTFVLPARAGDQDFTLVNRTGVEIHKVYASPHSSDDWEEDILGDDTLSDGESVNITFSPLLRAASICASSFEKS